MSVLTISMEDWKSFKFGVAVDVSVISIQQTVSANVEVQVCYIDVE